MSRRTVSDEERQEFERDYKEARPIKPARPAGAAKKKAPLVKGGSGINGATEERLKRGALEPEAKIDLHGRTETAAHRALLAFLCNAHATGLRLVLVVTGKGNPRNDDATAWTMRSTGVLKEMVPRWLQEPDFARLIAKVQPAHVRHGGGGALYVYLRKNR
jgi:DNA-nicking Smr family endonuclease